jgi:hypothetical protein
MDQILHSFAPCAQFAEDDEKRTGTKLILMNVNRKSCGARNTHRVFLISPLCREGKWQRRNSNSQVTPGDTTVTDSIREVPVIFVAPMSNVMLGHRYGFRKPGQVAGQGFGEKVSNLQRLTAVVLN